MKTIFISPISRETNEPNEWFAVRQEWFDWVPLSSCYDDNGQLVGSYKAGDHLEILTDASKPDGTLPDWCRNVLACMNTRTASLKAITKVNLLSILYNFNHSL